MNNRPEITDLEKILHHLTKTILLYECEDIKTQLKLVEIAINVAVQLDDFRKDIKE